MIDWIKKTLTQRIVKELSPAVRDAVKFAVADGIADAFSDLTGGSVLSLPDEYAVLPVIDVEPEPKPKTAPKKAAPKKKVAQKRP
jgi:hypothetical protein